MVEEFRPPDVPEGVRIYYGLAYHDGLVVLRRFLGRGPVDWRIRRLLVAARIPRPARAGLAWLFTRMGRRYDAQFFRFVRRGKLKVEHYWRLIDEQADYRSRFRTALDGCRLDALVCPPNALPALPHGSFYAYVGVS